MPPERRPRVGIRDRSGWSLLHLVRRRDAAGSIHVADTARARSHPPAFLVVGILAVPLLADRCRDDRSRARPCSSNRVDRVVVLGNGRAARRQRRARRVEHSVVGAIDGAVGHRRSRSAASPTATATCALAHRRAASAGPICGRSCLRSRTRPRREERRCDSVRPHRFTSHVVSISPVAGPWRP